MSAAPVRLERRDIRWEHETVYTLTIPDSALIRAHLFPFDRALLADCESADATVADKLLGLELLVRRIEEAHADVAS